MKKTSTLDDIAREAGVSPSTVSRVLNGSKRVAEAKRARVLAAVARHHYHPNPAARGLVRGQSMTIGVLMQDIMSPFFARMVAGIEQGLEHAPYQPMFTSTHWHSVGQEDPMRSLQLLLDRRVDGLIVMAGSLPDEALHSVATQLPVIVVARVVPGLETHCISVDNRLGAYRATRYLLGLGHTRIAHVAGTPGHPDAANRILGYQDALAEAGVELDPRLIVEGRFIEESGLSATDELLARGERFTAMFVANDQMAYGAMLSLYNHGYRIPDDMSLVGFDDQYLSAYTLPPLTTVRQPSTEMGLAAAQAILRLLDGEEPALPSFPADLIIRKSALHLRRRD